jgi:hypothetical protein
MYGLSTPAGAGDRLQLHQPMPTLLRRSRKSGANG